MAKDGVTGATILKVRSMTQPELDSEGWDEGGTALELNNGTVLYASRDEEGNGPGALFGTDSQGKSFQLISKQ